MGGSSTFKHISVVAEPEEDLVIEAGAVGEPAPQVAEPKPEPAQKPAKQSEPEVAAVAEQPKPETSAAPKPKEPVQKPAAQPKPKQKTQKDDYRDPTLEDLEDTPMPTVQKVVIVAAVELIVLAIVYCVFFMG